MKLRTRNKLLGIVLALLSPTRVASNDYGIFDWVRKAPGGVYHPNQVFEKRDGTYGVFAKEFIPKDTVLVAIPWTHVISGVDPDEFGPLCCGLVTRLKREFTLGNRSRFAPYIQYLKETQWNVSLPAAWTSQGQELLQAIVGHDPDEPSTSILPPDEPFKWYQDEWIPNCVESLDDELGVKLSFIIITRSDDDILIPGYDMYNHRNGHWLNTETTSDEGSQHVTIATKDIRKGEQIHVSYNLCLGCVGRHRFYGTGEILRDYGFIESFPQRFHYDTHYGIIQFDVDETPNGLKLTWDDVLMPRKDKYAKTQVVAFFRRQIRRLQRLRNIVYRNGNPGMPIEEWETSWDLQQAHIRAMTLAMESLQPSSTNDNPVSKTFTSSTFVLTETHYDSLGPQKDDLPYAEDNCDNTGMLSYPGHVTVEMKTSHYQDLRFRIQPGTKDVVLELDDVTQIASVYRPQYHEYSVHAAARFLDSVQRVIFIGGGDSMLLHEILKYPELELVVGLELDQVVTRKCFKYFSTQPHFDDPRVEWWFGDATKTLLLLPKEYWHSFDLVLVDLSETVMALSVTNHLDVFDALALLLQPHGILVKNEIYMEAISQVFDYSVQICYESPVLCDQVLAMGSQTVDFLHAPLKDHKIDTLLYTPMVTMDNRYDFLHDYRHNDALAQGKCNRTTAYELRDETRRRAGLLNIIEAEDVAVPLDETVLPLLESVVKQQGFHIHTDSTYHQGQLMIPLQEGYILARLIPAKRYCSMDIHLWGHFAQAKSLRLAIVQALQSQVVSNYRVVSGGMYGSTTWEQDRDVIGPQMAQTRNCSESTPPQHVTKAIDVSTLVTGAWEETMTTLYQGTKAMAVVLCDATKDCLAYRVLSKSSKTTKVIQLSSCKDLNPNELITLYECEIAFASQWKAALAGRQSDILVIDSGVSMEMGQIVNSILDDDDFRQAILSKINLVVAFGSDTWQQHFLDRYRKQYFDDPVSHAEYVLQSGSADAINFGVVSAGDDRVAYHLEHMEAALRRKFSDAHIELRIIHGGKYKYWDPWEPQKFLQSDYDDSPGLAQYFSQNPVAKHSLIQFEAIADSMFEFNTNNIQIAFNKSLTAVKYDCSTHLLVDDMSDGCLLVCLNPQYGTVVLTWDGRQHLDISYYLMDDGGDGDDKEVDVFIKTFRRTVNYQLAVVVRDDMPRGTGRVVNFPEDIMTPEQREGFLENLHQHPNNNARAFMNQQQNHQSDNLPKAKIVEEGYCSNPSADQSACWPEPPPLYS